jgi:hypothetical protein
VSRTTARFLTGFAVFAFAAGAAFLFTPRIASETLRVEAEKRLSRLMRSPVTIEEARLALGFGLRLEGRNATVWNEGEDRPGLRVDRIRAGVRTSSLLLGKPRFSWIQFDGARLQVQRDADGNWSPAPLQAFAKRREHAPGEVVAPNREALLTPLIAIENLARVILERKRIADRLELRDATVTFIDARAENRLAPPLFLALESVRGELRRNRLTNAGHLELKARVTDAQRRRGSVEWEGTRDRHGAIRIAMAVTDLELDALAPYVRSLHPEARLEANLSGAAVYRAPSPGHARLEIDLVGRDVRSVEPRSEATAISADRIEANGVMEVSPQSVRIHNARVRGGEIMLQANAAVARPLLPTSFAQVDLAFREVEVPEVRHLIGWLPDVTRDEAENIVRVVESGRLRSLRAGGSATLSNWQAFLAGRRRQPPSEFVLDATLAQTVLTVGDDDRIENLEGRLWWSGDHAEVVGVRGDLNGSPLPVLDVAVDGVTNFLAGEAARRKLDSGAAPLLGLKTLWKWFDDPDKKDRDNNFAVGLTIDRLHHPMFLWPIENAAAAVWNIEHGVHIVTDGGTWAGVPITGEADWEFEPEERVRVELTASAPREGEKVPSSDSAWAEGKIVVGIRSAGPWGQQHAISRFTAHDGAFHFTDVEIPLNPKGDVNGSIELNVGRTDSVPFAISFALTGGSVEELAEQLGQPPEVGTGNVDLAGSFRGVLRPGVSFAKDLSGVMEVLATDGTVRRSVPAVIAVALASEAYNPFIRREEVRYDRCQSMLEFEDGLMSTKGFSLDGPDLRVFATGEVDLLRPPHTVDAQVALFLFRQIDLILEKIPIVNFLLLGTNDNLIGAHFRLSGPWEDPEATAVPLRALASGPASIIEQGPASLVLQTIPMFMMKGIEAIDAMLNLGKSSDPDRVTKEPPVPEPNES